MKIVYRVSVKERQADKERERKRNGQEEKRKINREKEKLTEIKKNKR